MEKVFVGDFGAGNTCFYSVVIGADVIKPKALNDINGEPSGYCVDKNGNYVLGLDLYGRDYNDTMMSNVFHINIKAKPSRENEMEMIKYFSAWLRRLKERYAVEFQGIDKAYWMIGCPTGDDWKESAVRDKYREIFENAGFENVMIIPESNAALAYYQKTAGALENIDSNAGLLLLDQGAYSLDATYFENGEIKSKGSYLGAGLIEKMIVKTIINVPEEKYRLGKRLINLPETLETVRHLYYAQGEEGEKFRTYLFLKARLLKESFSRSLESGTLSNTLDLKQEVDLGEDEPFVLFINRNMMDDLLINQPIRYILGEEFNSLHPEVRDEIGANSWMGTFEQFLNTVDKSFPDFIQGRKTILLTGGGSMLPHIKEAVIKHYGNAAVYDDHHAVSAIGQGMAYWAPDKIRAEQFSDAFNARLDQTYIDEDGDEMKLISRYFSEAFLECIRPMAMDVTKAESDAVSNSIAAWAGYKCDSRQIPEQIKAYLDKWFQDTEVPAVQAEIDRQVDVLKDKLNSDFSGLLQQYGFVNQSLLAKDNQVFLSESKALLVKVFEAVEECIVDHYNARWKDDEFANIFEDSRKGFFSNKRQERLGQIAESLSQWIDKETHSTVDLIVEVFYNLKIRKVQDDEYTFSVYFVLEGYYDMFNLIEARKKELLGNLVLEEYMVD